jgi:hypothetical protein
MDHRMSNQPAFDPLRAWRDWFIENERAWSESLTHIMNTEPVSRAVGQEINAALHAEKMMVQGMSAPMAMMNLPTREDVVALGERVGRLEDAVARVEASLVQMRSTTAAGATTRATPRTRKLPARGAEG